MPLRQAVLAAAMAAVTAFAVAPQAQASPAAIKLSSDAVPISTDVIKAGRAQVSIGFGFYGGRAYYNGYRGHRHYRHGYRKHRGYYFHPRAFIVVVPRQRHVYVPRYRKPSRVHPRIIRLSHAHLRWCDARYRSYRHSDNTFQPYHGPRKQCVSPYY